MKFSGTTGPAKLWIDFSMVSVLISLSLDCSVVDVLIVDPMVDSPESVVDEMLPVEVGDVFTAIINGTSYVATATEATVKNVVELLMPIINVGAPVTCSEDDAARCERIYS